MNDISILYVPDLEIRNNLSPILESWANRRYLKNFLLVDKIDKISRKVTCLEFKDGGIEGLENLQKRLSMQKLNMIRFINVAKPEDENVDNDFKFFKNYINVPSNIKLVYLNLLIPDTEWLYNKEFNAVTTNANCNILIEPVDRGDTSRVPIDIDNDNFSSHTAMSALTVGAIWRGMKEGEFDNEKFDSHLSIKNKSTNRDADKEVIISRNYARMLVGPDPVGIVLESLSTENDNWVKPNDNFEFSNDDYRVVKSLSNKIIDLYKGRLSYVGIKKDSKSQKISILSFIRNRYQYLRLDNKLKDLSEYSIIQTSVEKFDDSPELNREKIDFIKEIETRLIKGTAGRGNTRIPELWKDIREIIFSLIDGSNLPKNYADLSKKQILNNLSVITKPAGVDIETLMGDETKFIQNSDSTEVINEVLEEEGIEIQTGQTFFENLIEFMFDQMNNAFLDFTTALKSITSPKTLQNNSRDEDKSLTKILKNLERFAVVVFITLVGIATNHFLILGNITPQIYFISWWEAITLQRAIFFVILPLFLCWIYLINKIYNSLNVDDTNANEEQIIQHSTQRIVELDNLIKQTEYWSKVYGMIIHSTFKTNQTYENIESLELSFEPLTSISAKLGTINTDVISKVLESIVKEGWFYELYKSFEDDFNEYLKNKTLRNEEVLHKLDTENSTELDRNSTRSFFLNYLQEGMAQKILYQLIEDKFDEFNKIDSLELFKGVGGKSIDEDNFVTDIKPPNKEYTKQDKEFDSRLGAFPNEIFNVVNIDRELKFDQLSIKTGNPIIRIVIRTDFSERVSIDRISDKINIDDNKHDDGEEENPDKDNNEKF